MEPWALNPVAMMVQGPTASDFVSELSLDRFLGSSGATTLGYLDGNLYEQADLTHRGELELGGTVRT